MPCRSQDPKFVYYLSGEADTLVAHSMSGGSWHRSRLPVLASACMVWPSTQRDELLSHS
jgi:hypothetical protein